MSIRSGVSQPSIGSSGSPSTEVTTFLREHKC